MCEQNVYELMIELKVVTPQVILNYANFLECATAGGVSLADLPRAAAQKYFEDAFRVYEKGISVFTYPHVLPIWAAYLDKFITRYKARPPPSLPHPPAHQP